MKILLGIEICSFTSFVCGWVLRATLIDVYNSRSSLNAIKIDTMKAIAPTHLNNDCWLIRVPGHCHDHDDIHGSFARMW